jgi:membrane protease subunit HflK
MNGRDIRGIPTDRLRPPKIPLKNIATIIVILVLAGLVWSAFFTIQPEEAGVVLAFGEYNRTTDPGWHIKWPYPIERVIKVPVQRQLKQEFGFRTERPGVRSTYSASSFESESLMLTGDLNVGVVEWITQYRVNDPYKYLFKVRNVTETFRDMNEAVMRTVIGDRSVSEVLTIGRQEIASEVERRLQEMCAQYETGIRVEQIVLQDVNPPDKVKPSFNEVNQAQQERERSINEARSEFNRVVPRARGEAQQVIQEAEGYALDRVNRAKGDAALFDALRAAYTRAPEVTRRRIYLETMQAVLPKVQKKVILDKDLEGILPLLPLDGGGQKP